MYDMTDMQTAPQPDHETEPGEIYWDRGPWNGARAQLAAFLVSLCVATGGGWLGYNHGKDVLQAEEQSKSGQVANDEFKYGALGAIVSFFGSELVLNFGLVALQRRRYELAHPELHANAPDTSN
jgi:hypothetical protein